MSRYMMINRLRWPVFLLMVGGIALFHQMGIVDSFWHLFWPLLLIMFGVFMLAERAALAAEPGYPPPPYPGAPYPGVPYPGQYPGGQPYPGAPYAGAADPNAATTAEQYTDPESTAIVPVPLHDLTTHDPEGGQS
jgi:hypothetical protein